MVSLRPRHLKRYRDAAWLLMKYGRSELAKKAGLADLLDGYEDVVGNSAAARADELAHDLEQRGPTYVKLGQMLSTRGDLLPAPYVESLTRLQDDVHPFDWKGVEQTVSTELDQKLTMVFRDFERRPIASASLSQVHRATLRSGRQVAVKVQRPDVRQRIVDDLDAFEEIAILLERHTLTGQRHRVTRLLDTFRRSLLSELDFRNEAHHLLTVGSNLHQFKQILVPQPVDEFTTAKVLTMDYVSGHKVVDLDSTAIGTQERQALAEELFRAYLYQVLVDGLFHADPHPGNLLLTPEHQIALLDLGLVVRLAPRLQEHLVKLLLSISEGRGEEAAEVAIRIGFPAADFNKAEFQQQIVHLVGANQDVTLDRVNLGQVVVDLNAIAAANGIQLPEEVTMMSKTLLNLDKSLAALHPRFNLNAAIHDRATEIMRKRHRPSLSVGGLYYTLSEATELVNLFPERMNKILELIADNQLKIDVNAVNERQLIQGIPKVANRITVGLLLAALIVGASLMMYVETSLTFFGYPAIAMFFFLAAAVGAIVLTVQILWKDK